MSELSIPVTDAFDDTDQFESLRVELSPEQIEWLEETAAERGLSVGHMLRTIITAQMRGSDVPSSTSETSGDGAVRPPSVDAPSGTDMAPTADPDKGDTAQRTDSTASADRPDRSDPPSIVDSLRSASDRLQNLTDAEERSEENTREADPSTDADLPDTESDLPDTLSRLQAHMGSPSENSSSEEGTTTAKASTDRSADADEKASSKTPSRTMLQNQTSSMFDMMDDE